MSTEAEREERVHTWMFKAWVALVPVSLLLRESTVWVVVISHVAILYAAWIAKGDARVERKVDAAAESPAPPRVLNHHRRPAMAAPVHGHDLVDHLITYRQPPAEVGEVMSSLRADFIALGHRIVDETPGGPDQTVAIRKLHEAAMATIANLALNPEDPT